MKFLIIRWLILTFAITIASYLIEGIRISGFFSAVFTAALLGILNTFLRPILLILTLPFNVLTLGLFTFVINAFLLMMASGVIPGFEVSGFFPAILGALIISIINWILNTLIRDISENGDVDEDIIDLEKKDDDRWE